MKGAVLTLALLVALASPVEAQRRRAAVPQTAFGSETPIRRRVRIARAVLAQIIAEERECLQNTGLSEAEAARNVAGSALDINGDRVSDLIAQGVGSCFVGAHSTTFWVYSKAETRLAPGFDLVLTTPADYLEVRRTLTNGYRDIETGNHTAVEMYITVWKFDGEKYQPRECSIETFRTRKRVRVRCERGEQ